MPSLNSVFVMGHLGRDPELRYTSGGQTVCNFNVAATDKWKSKEGQKQERTTWFRCVAWGQAAEFAAQYLKKGDAVFVQGSIEEREWEKDGEKRKTWEVRVSRVNSLAPRGGGRTSKPEEGFGGDEDVADEDLPF